MEFLTIDSSLPSCIQQELLFKYVVIVSVLYAVFLIPFYCWLCSLFVDNVFACYRNAGMAVMPARVCVSVSVCNTLSSPPPYRNYIPTLSLVSGEIFRCIVRRHCRQ